MYVWLGHQMIIRLRLLDSQMSANIVRLHGTWKSGGNDAPGCYYVTGIRLACNRGCVRSITNRFEGVPIVCAMSRRNGSLDALDSASEGLLDSTARSQLRPDLGNSESGPSRILINRIPSNLAEWFRNKESFESSESLESEDSSDTPETVRNFLLKQSEEWDREWTRKAIARGDIRPRKVSGVQHFPPGYGIGAALVSVEEYKRIQQAWIEEQRRKSQEEEKDPEEDSLMCSDQGDKDPKDT
ncbi:Uncharacterized protein TCM_018447 [Theobroma cacao]|uniref:Uncharacterized protein n=1 Tax=Theobroma cacao TaxID=3641 RepID=A0A061EFI1_THECC|nr:Uncharacterized protein TCM_018447 [Theobroma cacao]